MAPATARLDNEAFLYLCLAAADFPKIDFDKMSAMTGTKRHTLYCRWNTLNKLHGDGSSLISGAQSASGTAQTNSGSAQNGAAKRKRATGTKAAKGKKEDGEGDTKNGARAAKKARSNGDGDEATKAEPADDVEEDDQEESGVVKQEEGGYTFDSDYYDYNNATLDEAYV